MKKYTIGIDIGGTNTDAVIVDDTKNIVVADKTTTTEYVEEGFKKVLENVMTKVAIKPDDISTILVGTTHATNALLQNKDLFKVGVIRISSRYGNSIPPCYGWPVELKQTLFAGHAIVKGGFECDGRSIDRLDEQEIKNAIQELLNNGMESCAVIGIFSSLNNEQEELVAKLVKEIAGKEFPVSVSHRIGGVGFIERENATILNTALKKCMCKGFQALKQVMKDLGITGDLFLTQNNGTVLLLEEAMEYPILTISSGQTNSFVGATKLANLSSAIVVDIGGTSTDVGIVLDGFARRSVGTSTIAGIKLNFPVPDVLSVALGGGSLITTNDNTIMVGPESCAKSLKDVAQAFGGTTLTLTDVALYKKILTIPGAFSENIMIDEQTADKVMSLVQENIAYLTNSIGGIHKELPIIVTGGGSSLLDRHTLPERYIVPSYANVANAYGAALAEISGSIDTVVELNDRATTLNMLENKACQIAIEHGADKASVRIVNKEIIPYHYMPQNLARVKITAVGNRK